jgi:drug/metabolite transporter (DMT)-like permease
MRITNFPVLVFFLSTIVLWIAARIGTQLRLKRRHMDDGEREDLGVIVAAALTLLGLIIGFTFSMATTRYDQRKNLEEEEANAIGTEYLRVKLLPASDAVKAQSLLRTYLDQRILFYNTTHIDQLRRVNADTSRLQNDLWNAVQAPAEAHPTPVVALAVAGMNDVLNSQGYTQAAWWNRIPSAAWCLMSAIAICCNVLIGYTGRRVEKEIPRFFILPLIVAISFFLIADIDSPRGGIIRVQPLNLTSLAQSLEPQ